jgi:hypothetical protein
MMNKRKVTRASHSGPRNLYDFTELLETLKDGSYFNPILTDRVIKKCLESDQKSIGSQLCGWAVSISFSDLSIYNTRTKLAAAAHVPRVCYARSFCR